VGIGVFVLLRHAKVTAAPPASTGGGGIRPAS